MWEKREGYATLLLRKGVALQKGQPLLVNIAAENASFAELLCEQAYRMGASEVEVRFTSQAVDRQRLRHAPLRALGQVPSFRSEHSLYFLRRGACILDLESDGPDAGEPIDAQRLLAHERAVNDSQREYRSFISGGHTRWCVAALPGENWARRVFPHKRDPMKHLWRHILRCAHAGGDNPCGDWERHIEALAQRGRWLDSLRLRELRFAAEGTDLRVGLADGARWITGTERDQDGVQFSPNIPTEEVSTAPHRAMVNGTVRASMPLCYEGELIEGLRLRFVDGVVREAACTAGRDALERIFALDDNMDRLGEVALVPASSPVARSGLLFYNTLYDENAACHLALGSAAPSAVEGGGNRSAARARGLNFATGHVDFMFGTADLRCTGICRDGRKVLLMENGEFVGALAAGGVSA